MLEIIFFFWQQLKDNKGKLYRGGVSVLYKF